MDFPLDYDPESIGESTLASPLPWDKIQATSYRAKSNVSQLKTELINLHNARVKNDPEFAYFREASAYRQERSKQTSISLSEAARRQEKKDADAFWLGLENSKRQQQGLPAIASLDELNPERKPDLASNTGAPAGLPEVKSGDTDAADDQADDHANDAGAGAADVASSLVNSSHEGAEDSSLPPPRATEAPDPHLVESGNILLDLISLEQRTAAEKRPG